MARINRTKGQTMIYKIVQRNNFKVTKDRATRTPLKPGMNSVPAPHVALVVLLLSQTRWQVINEEMTGLWCHRSGDRS